MRAEHGGRAAVEVPAERLFLGRRLGVDVDQDEVDAAAELGDAGASEMTLQDERRLGETVMRDIRRDPQYLDDPEVAGRVEDCGPPGRLSFEGAVGMTCTTSPSWPLSLPAMTTTVSPFLSFMVTAPPGPATRCA